MINKSYLEKTIFKKFKKDLVEKYGTDIADEIWQDHVFTGDSDTYVEKHGQDSCQTE